MERGGNGGEREWWGEGVVESDGEERGRVMEGGGRERE